MPKNLPQKTDNIHLFKIAPMAEAKACFASASGGGAAIIPVKLIALAPTVEFLAIFIAFSFVSYPVYEIMTDRAMKNGQWTIKTMKKPKIDL